MILVLTYGFYIENHPRCESSGTSTLIGFPPAIKVVPSNVI